MLAAIFNINSENWTINSLLGRDGDVEIEEESSEDEETEDDEDEEIEKVSTPAENSDIFREDEENLTISECF